MTTPPLPDVSCVRCALDYSHDSGLRAGSRFYLSYTGSAPTGGNCATLATDIQEAWTAQLAGTMNADWSLVEVDVLDISSDDGLSGNWTGTEPGTRSGTALPAQVAQNVEYDIARRYRGGKPRMYLPPSVIGDLATDTTWSASWVAIVTAAVSTFFGDIEAADIGAIGTLQHVNLSYYQGFTNITNTSGRTRAAPKYRTSAKSDKITGYAGKVELSSQRRRRTSTSY